MRWTSKDPERWKPWFAWYPVCLEGRDNVWWEWLERKKVYVSGFGYPGHYQSHYREAQPETTHDVLGREQ